MILLERVGKSFEKPVLHEISFCFEDQGLYLIRGASGVGKTTLLRILAGLEKPDQGEIRISGDPKISVVFQEARLIPFLTLEENLYITKPEREPERAREILSSLGLWEDRSKMPPSLSGGMRLRGAIARSLYYGGDVFLWDEPTKELDPENRDIVIDWMEKLAREHTVIVITHDPELRGGTVLELKDPLSQDDP